MTFPGLLAGDRWCLCAARWLQAYEAGVAPKVRLEATHEKALDIIPLSLLEEYAAAKPAASPSNAYIRTIARTLLD